MIDVFTEQQNRLSDYLHDAQSCISQAQSVLRDFIDVKKFEQHHKINLNCDAVPVVYVLQKISECISILEEGKREVKA